jgi:hypothetical protein
MKMSTGLAALVMAASIALTANAQTALSTAFTYQGKLTERGTPADGLYDIQFKLFDAAAGGSQIGATFVATGVDVSQGIFTARPDFGTAFNISQSRWLEIAVRIGFTAGPYTLLTGRQELTATPFAEGLRLPLIAEGNGTTGFGQSQFVLSSNRGSGLFGGMYVNTSSAGRSFYGYSAGGVPKAYTEFNDAQGLWSANIGTDTPRFSIRADNGFVGVARSTKLTPYEAFGVNALNGANAFGGMYINTDATGRSFYGYGAGGVAKAYTEYNDATGTWNANIGSDTPKLSIRADNGFVGVGRSNRLTGFENFGVNALNGVGAYGGMYINTDTSGHSFYGYGANGVAKAYTEYDDSTGVWNANIGNDTPKLSIRGDNGFVGVGRSNRLTNFETFGVNATNGVGAFGGMYINTDASGHSFYGYGANGVAKAYTEYNDATGVWNANIGSDTPKLSIRGDNGFVGVGRSNRLTNFENFGVNALNGANAYGGMYINTDASGIPFYGYAAGGAVRAYTQYADSTGLWSYVNPNGSVFNIASNGNVGFGTTNTTQKITMAGGAFCTGTTWNNACDRNLKEDFRPINSDDLLDKVAQLPITSWRYKGDDKLHVGPTAQDFRAAFGLGENDTSISTVDADGVSLAAIKSLTGKLREQEAEISDLKRTQADTQARLKALEDTIASIQRNSASTQR